MADSKGTQALDRVQAGTGMSAQRANEILAQQEKNNDKKVIQGKVVK